MADYLTSTEYSLSLEGASQAYPRAPGLAKAFRSCLISRCYRLVKIAPGGSKRFLEAYFERFLVDNMKRVLGAKHTGTFLDRSSLPEIPKEYERPDLTRISDAPTIQDAVKSLEGTRFQRLADAMEIYERHGLVAILDASLDKIYYDSEVRPALEKAKSGCLREMVGVEVDLMSAKTLTDLRARGVPAEEARTVCPLPLDLDPETLTRMSEATADSIPGVLSKTRYADLAGPLRGALDPASDESLELVVASEIRRYTKRLMFGCPLSLGYVLGYVREAETEANNLASIVTGKELGLAESRIEAALCL